MSSFANNSNKYGEVKKCPACNALINSFSSLCEECGYEFRNIEVNKFVKSLSEKLEKVVSDCELKSYEHLVGSGYSDEESARKSDIIYKHKFVIKNFPIPNTKEDILELLFFIQPKTELGLRADKNVFEWRSKYKEILTRAKSSFRSSKSSINEISQMEVEFKKVNLFSLIITIYLSFNTFLKTIIAFILVFVILYSISKIL